MERVETKPSESPTFLYKEQLPTCPVGETTDDQHSGVDVRDGKVGARDTWMHCHVQRCSSAHQQTENIGRRDGTTPVSKSTDLETLNLSFPTFF